MTTPLDEFLNGPELEELAGMLKSAFPLPWGEVGGVRGDANRQLVVAAVNALPKLLEAAEELRRLRSALEFLESLTADGEDWTVDAFTPEKIKECATELGWRKGGDRE